MDNNKLEYFVSAAQSLNFSEVARTHYISQPAVSHQINLLEEELGVQLFVRVGRQLLLTSEGELFLPHAIQILQNMHETVQLVQRNKQGKSGKVSIVVANTNSATYKKCLAMFSKRYPNILVDTTIALGYEQTNEISKGNFDFCFIAEYMVADNASLDYTVTQQDRMCLVLPKSFPPVADLNDFSQLEDYPFIGISYESSPLLKEEIQNICRQRSYTPKVVHQYNRTEAVLWSVDAGVGISIVPISLISLYATENITCIPIPGDDCVVNCVAGWQRVSKNTAALKFKEVVLELYPKEPANTMPADGV
ncbi:DNA-binding transcriptional regulator, LysR family [Sporobacter termitidis DSM 10068]|uniref:DNA-binding transcriptional regulator, LysR family n=1 Tax=Sporobacter termitidis DSM 10068 TaxID=1123282 RepID=A0A1M5XUX5_9FIRM|nr:LysR family transcriptional regulator [Sporobacter termitidis]SHI03556.1 DNA-binding transcriptional regulator, LysR family [Sporobacter termitidis DSM 10068]